jgi:hypothetical protein
MPFIGGVYYLPSGDNPPFPGNQVSTNTLTLIIDDIADALNNIPPIAGSAIKVGTTQVQNGTNGYFLYNNNGIVGNELVPNSALANSTISGIALGGNLATLSYGAHLTNGAGASSYNGSIASTIVTDATNANTASTIVARDGSGNFSAGVITASLTGHASLDLALTGGMLTGPVVFPDGSTWSSGGIANLLNETIVGGTLADQEQALTVSATNPALPSANQYAIFFTAAGNGTAAHNSGALLVAYTPGYTGSSRTIVAAFNNTNAGTGSTLIPSGGGNFVGNLGDNGTSLATTTGLNIGTGSFAGNGNINVGVAGLSQTTKNSALNIGIFGSALNGGTSSSQIGAYFTLNGTQPSNTTPSAALIADNGSQTNPVALFRVGSVTKFSINPAGNPNFTVYTVTTLPASPSQGDVALVSDATSNTVLGPGGGTAYALAAYTGAAWVAV